MPDLPSAILTTVFAKTVQGQQEIQARTLGLQSLARRVLVLVNGQRSGKDLAAFVPGDSIESCLSELLTHTCIEALAPLATAPTPAPLHSADTGAHPLADLPQAATRSAQELEKARNFMTNTVNNLFGHHNRITLIESIFSCQSSDEELRRVYPAWANAVSSNGTGKKRLPELREKLFTVL